MIYIDLLGYIRLIFERKCDDIVILFLQTFDFFV